MAKKAAKQEQLEVIVQDEDEQLVATIGGQIVEFVRGLVPFFQTAKQLETRSLATLEEAERIRLAPPKTAEEDEKIQRFIKRTSAEKTEVEAHWKVTAAVSQFHRRMTARRGRSTDALEKANEVANLVHNQYVAAEKRRAAEEQARLDREAEEEALRQRELELELAEAEAVKREEQSAMLSDRERMFVEAYTTPGYHLGNAQQSATRAGYRDPLKTAARLLSNAKIQKAIQAAQEALAIRRQAEATRQQPIAVQPTRTVRPNITKAAGAIERTNRSAELTDEKALIDAILQGDLGIPTDLLRIDPATLNRYARDLKGRIKLWPGVKYIEDTKVI